MISASQLLFKFKHNIYLINKPAKWTISGVIYLRTLNKLIAGTDLDQSDQKLTHIIFEWGLSNPATGHLKYSVIVDILHLNERI